MNNYRTRLILELLDHHETSTMPSPSAIRSVSSAVTIVIEGGVDTIRLIHYDLSRPIPVMIVDVSFVAVVEKRIFSKSFFLMFSQVVVSQIIWLDG